LFFYVYSTDIAFLSTFSASFSEYEAREGCPVDCVQHHFHYQITDARFLHSPPIGVEPALIRNENLRKGQNTSHLLQLVESLSSTELADYVKYVVLYTFIFFLKGDIFAVFPEMFLLDQSARIIVSSRK
jgi:hypothetical protein